MKTLNGHTNEETAYLVNDYPYGFSLRTQIRYWIETTKRGDRFVSQTLNPKTNRWNKPKKSTYSDIVILFLNEDEHVKAYTYSIMYTGQEELDELKDKFPDYPFSEAQLQKLKQAQAVINTRKHIKFECVNTTFDSDEQREAREQKQKETNENVSKLFNYEYMKLS